MQRLLAQSKNKGWLDKQVVEDTIKAAQEARERVDRESWTDPATGLMWATRDNGSDVTWQGATDYCRNLQLAGHSDYRLATIDELHGIYDKNVKLFGQCCGGKKRPYHVKGNLQLSGWGQWSSSRFSSDGAWTFTFTDGTMYAYAIVSGATTGLCVCAVPENDVVSSTLSAGLD